MRGGPASLSEFLGLQRQHARPAADDLGSQRLDLNQYVVGVEAHRGELGLEKNGIARTLASAA